MPLQDWHDFSQVAGDYLGAVPLVTTQENMTTDDISPPPLRELNVMSDQYGVLIVRIDRQCIIASPGKSGISGRPRIVATLPQHHGYTSVNILVADKTQDQATVSRSTVSMSDSVRSGYASSMSCADLPACR